MIEATFKLFEEFHKILDAEHKAAYKNLGHAAASIRKAEIESIHFGKGPSTPGTAPHTHGKQFTKAHKERKGELQRAILYVLEDERAIIGPRFSVVGTSAMAHEFGGEYKGQEYPERPFARPAVDKNLDRFAKSWEYAIGE